MTLVSENLTFGYSAAAPIVEGYSQVFRSGEVVALTGPSGCGKSTLLYLLAGLLRPTAGTVSFDGRSIYELSDSERSLLRADRFGFVFQDTSLDPHRSIVESVLEPALYAGGPTSALVARAQELLATLQVRVDIGRRPGQISGGQAQRVGVCRALLMRPSVLFADEPTANLDADNAAAVLDALVEAAAGGASVVIATHDARVLERCTEVVRL